MEIERTERTQKQMLNRKENGWWGSGNGGEKVVAVGNGKGKKVPNGQEKKRDGKKIIAGDGGCERLDEKLLLAGILLLYY